MHLTAPGCSLLCFGRLQFTALFFPNTILQQIAMHCTVLPFTALYCSQSTVLALHCTAENCTSLQYTALFLQYLALHGTALHCVLSIVQCNFYRMLLSCQKIKGYHIIEHTWCFINPVICTVPHDSSGVLNIIVKCCC